MFSVTRRFTMALFLIQLQSCARKRCIWSLSFLKIFIYTSGFFIIFAFCNSLAWNCKRFFCLNSLCLHYFIWYHLFLLFLLILFILLNFFILFHFTVHFFFKLYEMKLLHCFWTIKTNLIVIFWRYRKPWFRSRRFINFIRCFRSWWNTR